MPIDATLAQFSDWSFRSAFGVYLLAAVFLIAQYATQTVTAAEQKSERQLVAAGKAPVRPTGPGRIEEAPRRPASERYGGMGYALVVLGLLLTVTSIVLRGFATDRFPLGNMYEFVTMATAAATATSIIALRKMRPTLIFVVVPVMILMFLAATVLYADAAPVVPALRSYWLPIHVTIVSIGSGIFLVAGVASLLFLLRMRFPATEDGANTGALARFAQRLPDARTLDRLAYKTTIIGFPLFGAGVILGAIWAEAAWGRFWGWDPKETVSFIAWVVYAAYLHARATSGWRNTRAAWINVAGFVAMLFNLFIINMVVSGLHSYAGLN
ncbi:c-type cytochrome biogenesis protein CcsB [Rhodococcus sp. BP-349]|jgi:cytochrome c-type biogenesis protein CcsB|uniref:c-type cytochrome biogenesis protein CcsB n=1 Tax=unclassified Rhodococcus (in: high G+C Gram-positive bacteria) TaxID=192944 RepID=UPI0006F7FB7C|nr:MULTISPECIES: c-type cytochrome biogenesis protein CcsB [unclassified Rhodococcus (in: high G+C Gram-positive bacteria)]KQU36289.1 cytochrome C assembly protein [Rhodococcus sp. Leaf225]KQU48837.1 cytochrome C assembly protein [Rhodococcus sp. Leaf258]MBY6539692.1 c-type cytochrome biogenesis protein CcsB [Rhodococcus sp. BP-363]MBY6543980.1 c-type cytochrome biogenesis protein CcsB [Rhodococcus sp. BP-369]MBY6563210.1 c-type cytochrome biogenesis protein CcsB [Rhodococcus sp. BP-370]